MYQSSVSSVNTLVLQFVNKAQNKIAELSSLIVDRGGFMPDSLVLLLELSDFISSLDTTPTIWNDDKVLRYIEVYNRRANLNSVPYLQLSNYQVNIVNGSSTGQITTADIVDYISATNGLIKASSHNTLSNLQGGSLNARYHLTLDEITKIRLILYPFSGPTVALSSSISGNGWYELGTTIASTTLTGSYTLNSGGSATRFRYNKKVNGVVTNLITVEDGDSTPFFVANINKTTTYIFEMDFEVGGTKSAEVSLRFVTPMWFGTTLQNKVSTDIQLLTKVIEAPQNPRNFTFVIPSNNTTVALNLIKVPYILVAKSRGIPTIFRTADFNIAPSWKITGTTVTLQDGTTEPYWLCEYIYAVSAGFDCLITWV